MSAVDEYDLLEQQVAREKDHKDSKRSHKHSSKERDRDRGQDRDRDRDKNRDRGPDRHRSKSRRNSRERRRRSRSRSKDRHRLERPREKRRDKTPSRPPPPRRAETPPEVREQKERERELLELDRDIRTIFAYNLPLRATEKELFQFFSSAGKIVDVRIIMDRNTRKSKGFAYIEFANRFCKKLENVQEDIVKAMGLTGQILMGQAVMVKSSEAEKNLAWEAAQAQAASMAQLNSLQNAGQGPCKLLIQNLHPNIAEGDLRQIFEPFGPVESASIQKESGLRPQSFGFVQYTSAADANKAMQQLDQMDIAGQKITVKIAPMTPGETAQLAAAAARVDLDDEDEGGMRLNSSARAALMNRLAGTSAAPSSGATSGGSMAMPQNLPGPPPTSGPVMSAPAQALALEQGVLGPSSPRPTQCVLLKNMFDPTKETEPEWDKDIAEDVKEECSKFGSVGHVYVDRNSKGFVYLKFVDVEGAVTAQRALHGRWFAGNQVVAEFQFVAPYNDYFRCS